MPNLKTLYQHIPHPHKPVNVNEAIKAERTAHANAYNAWNEKAAVWMTRLFSTMELFWVIDLFMALWIIGNSIGIWHFDPIPFPLLLMIINIPQLPLLPLLAIGQAVLSRKQELQADEMFATTQHSFHDIEQIGHHLDAQDTKIIEILERIDHQEQLALEQNTNILTVLQKLEALQGQKAGE